MAWLRGKVSVDEAISEITKVAVLNVMEMQLDGYVIISLDSDGTYYCEQPKTLEQQ